MRSKTCAVVLTPISGSAKLHQKFFYFDARYMRSIMVQHMIEKQLIQLNSSGLGCSTE